MSEEPLPIDIADVPELAHLLEEVRTTRRPRLFTDHGKGIAVLYPLSQIDAPRLPLPRFPKGDVIAATAGILRHDGPALSIEEEKAAFEQGVADEVMKSMEE
jgi:hypothetical protein